MLTDTVQETPPPEEAEEMMASNVEEDSVTINISEDQTQNAVLQLTGNPMEGAFFG